VRVVTEAGKGSPHGAARVSRQASEQRKQTSSHGRPGPVLIKIVLALFLRLSVTFTDDIV
jgi:hypothetical protein